MTITTKEARKKVEKLRKKIGMDIWDELMNEFWKLELKIEELIKSRNKWKDRYMEVNIELEQLKKEMKKWE